MFTPLFAFVRSLFSKGKATEKQQPVVKIDQLNLDQPKKTSENNGLDSCAHTYACGARMYLGNRKS